MKLLPQTQFTLIHQLLIVETNRHNFLLGKSLRFLTSTHLGLVSNLSTLWKTIIVETVLWTSLSVIQPRMRSPTRPRTSSGPTISVIGTLNHITRTNTLLNEGIEPSRPGLTPSLIGLVLLPISGCSPSNMSVSSLMTSSQYHLVA